MDRGSLVVTMYGQRTAKDITDTEASPKMTVLAWVADMATVLTAASVIPTGVDSVDTAMDILPTGLPGLLMVLESPELLGPLPVAVALEPPHPALALPAA